MAVKSSPSEPIPANLAGLLAELETIYKDIHSHPELSMQEERTAGVAANHLRAVGYEVTTGGWQDRRCRLAAQRRRAEAATACVGRTDHQCLPRFRLNNP
jgi:metal-dependent amidase/aminoacylase/carboxypeptidase family protein